MAGCRIDLSRTFNRLVKPASELSYDSILIHGITPSEVDGKPDIQSALVEFAEFCADNILVGYCISIDLTFLNKQMRQCTGRVLQNPAVDIYRLYEWVRRRFERRGDPGAGLPVLKASGLYEMARVFCVPLGGSHDALMDAFLTAQLFQRLIHIISGEGILSVKDLLTIADPYGDDDHLRKGAEKSYFPM
jgi:DNA polymerase-3 subunit epsilon